MASDLVNWRHSDVQEAHVGNSTDSRILSSTSEELFTESTW